MTAYIHIYTYICIYIYTVIMQKPAPTAVTKEKLAAFLVACGADVPAARDAASSAAPKVAGGSKVSCLEGLGLVFAYLSAA
jgi:hypothetical protein